MRSRGPLLRRFMRALARGHEALRKDIDTGVDALVKANPDLKREPAARAGQGDAAGLLPARQDTPVRLPGPARLAALHAVDARERADRRTRPSPPRVHERVPAGRGHLSAPRDALACAHARRLALHAQGLAAAPPRAPAAGPRRSRPVVQRIGCLQLDPVSAVARSPLLVLFARLGPAARRRRSSGGLRAARAVRRLGARGVARRDGRPAAAPLGDAHGLRRRRRARAVRARAFLDGQRRVLRRARRRAARARAAARPRPRGPLGGAVAPRLVDRRGLRAPDDRAAAAPAVDVAGASASARRDRRASGCGTSSSAACPTDAPDGAELDDDERRARGGAARRADARRRARRRTCARTSCAAATRGCRRRSRRSSPRAGWSRSRVAGLRRRVVRRAARTSSGCRRRSRRARARPRCRRSTTCSATAPARPSCSASTIASRSTCRRRSGAGATTCCRSCTASGSSRAPTLRSTAGAGVLRVHALHREPDVRRTPALDRAVARALERLAAWRGAGEVLVAKEA